jgi:hypothetical protein
MISMRLRRLAAGGVALAVSSVAFAMNAVPASAQGNCPQSLAGWRVAPADAGAWPPPYYPSSDGGRVDTGAQVLVYGRASGGAAELVVQFRNVRANGKSAVIGRVGSSQDASDLGVTGSFGPAPRGAWCSDISRSGFIWTSLSYRVGGVAYSVEVSGTASLVFQ